MKLNQSKCHKLTLSGKTKMTDRKYTLDGKNTLSKVENEKDLGVIIDSRLPFEIILLRKQNSMVAIIKKRFLNLTVEIMAVLQNLGETASGKRQSVVEPIPEKRHSSNSKYSAKVTRLIRRLCKLAYYERLKILKLPILEYRRKRGSMIEVYKILNCVYDGTATERKVLKK